MTTQPQTPTVTLAGHEIPLKDMRLIIVIRELPRARLWQWLERVIGIALFEKRYQVIFQTGLRITISEREKPELDAAIERDQQIRSIYGMAKGLGLRG